MSTEIDGVATQTGSAAEPLRLLAEDADDLQIISAALQDAILRPIDIVWEKQARTLTIAFSRFCWECGGTRVLSAMQFGDVLAEAQRLGYAESDPSFDIDGVDAAHKLAILTSVAFGCAVDFDAVHIEGIRHISALDIEYAKELGYRIKLLGIARRNNGGIEQRVHPAMVPIDSPIAAVDGVFNAVVADGDFVEKVTLVGRGAGAGPTASAVVADLLDVARGRITPVFGVPSERLARIHTASPEERRGAYYLRLMVVDRPGVIADVAAALRDENVSMEAFLQRGRAPGEAVPVVLTTHDTDEASIQRALKSLDSLEAVLEQPRLIRIEQF